MESSIGIIIAIVVVGFVVVLAGNVGTNVVVVGVAEVVTAPVAGCFVVADVGFIVVVVVSGNGQFCITIRFPP